MSVKTTKISAVSRTAFKDRHDNWYTFEFAEEREIISDLSEEELDIEREKLWDTINGQVDDQVTEILDK